MTARQSPPPSGKRPATSVSASANRGETRPSADQLDALLAECLRTQTPPQPEPLGDAELADVMARLRLRGPVGDSPVRHASPAAASRLPHRTAVPAAAQPAPRFKRAKQWAKAVLRLPQAGPPGVRGGAAGLGWATPVVALLGVLVVLAWPDQAAPPDDGATVWQQKGGADVAAPPARGLAPAQWLPSPQPATDAAQLAAELTAAGAAVQVLADGRDRLLQFSTPVAASGAVGQVLLAWGLAPVAGGAQQVRLADTPE